MRLPSFNRSCSGMVAMCACILMACGNNEGTATTSADTTALNSDAAGTTTGTTTDTAGTGAQAVLNGTQADTAVTGTVRFQEAGGRVTMNLEITAPKMASKSVAVHIHEHGSCGDMGKEAHGHWNPTKAPHGKWGEGQFHSGDIGNVSLDASGKGTMQLETDLWSLSGTDSTRNILNKAIIVHSGTDDYKSQPAGNAGSRIGCGVITRM